MSQFQHNIRRAEPRVGHSLVQRVAKHKNLFFAAAGVAVIQAGVSLSQPQLVAQVLERFQANQSVTLWLSLLISLLVIGATLMGLQQLFISLMTENVVRDTRRSIAKHILSMPFSEIHRFRRGDLLSRATGDTQLLRQALMQSSVQLISGAIIGVGALVAMAFVDAPLFGLTMVAVLASLSLVAVSARRLKTLAEQSQEGAAAYSSTIERALAALPTIRSFNAIGIQLEAVEEAVHTTWDKGARFARLASWLTPASSIAIQFSLLVVLGVGGARVVSGSLSIAELITFVMYLVMLVGPVGQAAGAITALNQASAAHARISEIENIPAGAETTSTSATLEPIGSTKGGIELPVDLEFDNVSFMYPRISSDSSKPTLDHVSFRVLPGQKVGIVGPSGAGKSTLLSLIERFYDPQEGSIRLGGIPTHKMSVEDLRRHFAYVQQEAPVLAGSIFENLRLGAQNSSDADCAKALTAVNLDYLIQDGSNGNDMHLGDHGVNLSGGERQRLAIARALLSNRPILLLDEATSQIDSRNESVLQEALQAMAPETTQIIVAHRMSTIIDSDQIIVMRDGRIEDIGTHEELLDINEFYALTAQQQLLVTSKDETEVERAWLPR